MPPAMMWSMADAAVSAQFVHRNRVHEGRAAGIAAVAGLVAAVAGASPTGSTFVDMLLLAVTVGVVTWASASAPWWASAGAAGIAAVVAVSPAAIIVAGVAFVVGLYIGVRRKDLGEARAVVGGIAMNVLLWSELDGFFGLSALIGVAVGAALLVLGLRRRP